MTLRLRPEAEADIERIALYIAGDNPAAAKRWFEDMHRSFGDPSRTPLDDGSTVRCRHLAETPGMGVARPDVRPDLRIFPVGNYLIVYREIAQGVEVVRVLHGARRWQELLR